MNFWNNELIRYYKIIEFELLFLLLEINNETINGHYTFYAIESNDSPTLTKEPTVAQCYMCLLSKL